MIGIKSNLVHDAGTTPSLPDMSIALRAAGKSRLDDG